MDSFCSPISFNGLNVSPTPKFTGVSLFSGAGGMDVGFQRAGVKVVWANEIDRHACETFRLNQGGSLVQGDLVQTLPGKDLVGVDVLFGGPPCQGFSVAGKMDPNDDRNRLLFSFFDAVEAIRPNAFVCENVKALAVLGKWSSIRSAVEDRVTPTYRLSRFVLNSSDFGVPQNRERMFWIGIRKDVFPGSSEDLRASLQMALDQYRKRPTSVGEIVRTLGPAGTPNNTRTCKAAVSFAKAPIMRASPYAGMLFNGGGRPLRSNGVASTLPASMGGNRTPIVDEDEIFHDKPSFVESYHADLVNGLPPKSGRAPINLRRLTIDECLAIQTFPPGYMLSGPNTAMYRQIGNAVPPLLAEVVARATLGCIST